MKNRNDNNNKNKNNNKDTNNNDKNSNSNNISNNISNNNNNNNKSMTFTEPFPSVFPPLPPCLRQVKSSRDFEHILKTAHDDHYFLINFYYEWCPFSQEFKPYFSALVGVFPTLTLLSIDASLFDTLKSRFSIHGVPLVGLFKGKEADHIRTFHHTPKTNLEALIIFVHNNTGLFPSRLKLSIDNKVELNSLPFYLAKPIMGVDIYFYFSTLFVCCLFLSHLIPFLAQRWVSRKKSGKENKMNHRKTD